ncbi:MAG: hypothetical protein KAR39_09090 [Thermoplasmata archaeon]|nr:hypothetical protein [Thermoplasmata archaeon]
MKDGHGQKDGVIIFKIVALTIALSLVVLGSYAALRPRQGNSMSESGQESNIYNGWTIETVSTGQGVGFWSSLDLDSEESPHLSFMGSPTDDTSSMIYGVRTGQDWQTRPVDTKSGDWNAFSLDNDDVPHVLYNGQDSDSVALRFSSLENGEWETVSLTETTGQRYLSMDFDGLGRLHATYYHQNDMELIYLRWDGETWLSERVGSCGLGVSLALDEYGHPHIAYVDCIEETVVHAFRSNKSVWVYETVDYLDEPSSRTSIVIDDKTAAHIFYLDGDRLKYSNKIGGVWESEEVDQGLGPFQFRIPCILGPDGRLGVAYLRGGVLTFASLGINGWTSEAIDTGVGGISLAIDSEGRCHISYHHSGFPSEADSLRYAWKDMAWNK